MPMPEPYIEFDPDNPPEYVEIDISGPQIRGISMSSDEPPFLSTSEFPQVPFPGYAYSAPAGMSNEQLAIMLESMCQELRCTLHQMAESMPEDAPRVEAPLVEFARQMFGAEAQYSALVPLANLLASWQQRIETLRGNGQ